MCGSTQWYSTIFVQVTSQLWVDLFTWLLAADRISVMRLAGCLDTCIHRRTQQYKIVPISSVTRIVSSIVGWACFTPRQRLRRAIIFLVFIGFIKMVSSGASTGHSLMYMGDHSMFLLMRTLAARLRSRASQLWDSLFFNCFTRLAGNQSLATGCDIYSRG